MKDVDFDRLGNSFGNEKPKNDMYQTQQHYTPKERGGCLSLFLGFVLVGNVLMLIYLLGTFSQYRGLLDGGWSLLVYGLFAIQVGVFISAIGLWNWKKWGYNGMLAGYGIGIVISLISGAFTSIIGSIIGILILTGLMKGKMHLLD